MWRPCEPEAHRLRPEGLALRTTSENECTKGPRPSRNRAFCVDATKGRFGNNRERLKESQRAHFDTFTRRSIGRAGGIFKGRMRCPARAAVFLRIVALEDERFVALHLRKVKPPVIGVERDVVNLAEALWISAFGWD